MYSVEKKLGQPQILINILLLQKYGFYIWKCFFTITTYSWDIKEGQIIFRLIRELGSYSTLLYIMEISGYIDMLVKPCMDNDKQYFYIIFPIFFI